MARLSGGVYPLRADRRPQCTWTVGFGVKAGDRSAHYDGDLRPRGQEGELVAITDLSPS